MTDTDTQTAILFVCLGNICRSPAAEGIMQQRLEQLHIADRFYIDSAGIGGWHIGQLPDERMRRHGSMRGYNFYSRARQLEVSDLNRFDYIIVMDHDNYKAVKQMARDEIAHKIHLMTEFTQKYKNYQVVPDPYYGGDKGFELVLDLLEDACDGLINYVLYK